MKPDKTILETWWDQWPHGERVVLTVISVDKKNIETHPYTFTPEKKAEFLKDVVHYNGSLQWNVYFTVCPTTGPVTKKPTKAEIKEAPWLWVDCDPRTGEDFAAERERILKRLQEHNPKPTAILDSGGGYWGYWRLQAAVSCDDAERYNQQLELDLGADNCHNCDRLARLPGTVNWPDEKKAKKGRVPALAGIIEFDPARVYPASQFKMAPAPSNGDGGKANVDTANVTRINDLDTLPDRVPDLCKLVIAQGTDPEQPDRFASRSESLFFVCCELLRAEVDDATVFAIITDPGWPISASVLDKGRNVERYAQRQIERAHVEVEDFETNDKGQIRPSIMNVRRALHKMGVELYYDEFADRDIIEGLPGFGPVLQDDAVIRLWLQCEEVYHLVVAKERFYDIVVDCARRQVRNPVQEYLDSLKWDGKPRIDTWLTTYLGVLETPYTRAVGRLVLVAAVRRAMQPGCKFDEMLILESEQGKDKSSALKTLAVQEEWFADDLVLSDDAKRQIEQISGKWIIEAGELKGMRSRQVEFLKSFLSRQVDRARMSYARLAQEYPRRCIIIGTTNDDSYLQDETGNRRFWPVATGKIDLKALRADRGQLWAEAAQAEAQGESIRLDPSLYAAAAVEQEGRVEQEPWCDQLEQHLGDHQGKVCREVLWQWLGYESSSTIRRDDGKRLSRAMKQLGFQRFKNKVRFDGYKQPRFGFWRGNKEIELKEPF